LDVVAVDCTAMPVEVHDNALVSYEVQCEARRILMRTEYRGVTAVEVTDVVFTAVQGYHFQHGALGNIIAELQEVPLESFLDRHRSEIEHSYHQSGVPGPWAA
jgi:hypothetical protein